jgi:hypothetical protein
MTDSASRKVTRVEYSARVACQRSLKKSLRTQAKGAEWKAIDAWLFQQRDGWFISVLPCVWVTPKRTQAKISVKPMAIDPIFWDLVGLPENRKMPLSFRASAAWACHPPCFAEIDVEEHEDTAVLADRVIAVANEQMDRMLRTWSVDAFLSHCQHSGVRWGTYLPCTVTTLVAMDRTEEALATCKEAHARGVGGGFSAPQGTFVEMAMTYLQDALTRGEA